MTHRQRKTHRRKELVPGILAGLALAVTVLFSATVLSQQSHSCGGGGWPAELFCFDHDTPARAAEVNGNFKAVVDRMDRMMAPVGSIVAWHKSLGGISIPAGWVECNGGSVSDPESPINGGSIPDLNGGRFLRGASTSGTFQNDAFQGHRHTLNSGQDIDLLRDVHPSGSYELFSSAQVPCAGCSSGYHDIYSIVSPSISNPTSTGSHGSPRIASETRPTNMSVVWIMRIK